MFSNLFVSRCVLLHDSFPDSDVHAERLVCI